MLIITAVLVFIIFISVLIALCFENYKLIIKNEKNENKITTEV